ncbi:MAG TPA: DMT family transporter [Candidatus Dormibacteraeota bacterium]|jgi:drug/metabolite transporter (DMT)-like permease|nr:DMT family transporter [Candidatus Dormibacteraeota bacterium]
MSATDDTKLTNPSASHSGAAEWLILSLPGLIWGASYLFIADALGAIGPGGVTLVRLVVGFLTLSLFPSARKPVLRSDWLKIVALGAFWMAFPLSMFPFAERYVSSALTGMLNGANPLFTATVAALIAWKLPSRRVIAGIAIGMAGAVVIALPTLHEGRSTIAGVGMILAALVSYGVALNLASPLQQRNGALPVILRAQLVALILVAPFGLRDVFHVRWEPGPLAALLALGVLSTGVAFAIMSVSAGRFGATRASSAAFLIPAEALVLGVLFRGEHVAALSIIGGVVCVTGALIMRSEKAARKPSVALASAPAE